MQLFMEIRKIDLPHASAMNISPKLSHTEQ